MDGILLYELLPLIAKSIDIKIYDCVYRNNERYVRAIPTSGIDERSPYFVYEICNYDESTDSISDELIIYVGKCSEKIILKGEK